MLAHAFGKARRVGLELEVRPIVADELGKLVQRQHALDHEGLVSRHVELVGEEACAAASGMRASTSSRMTVAAAAPLEQRLEHAHQILGLLLDLEVAVADDAEAAEPLHHMAGEKLVEKAPMICSSADEARSARLAEIGEAHEARDLLRHAHERVERAPVRLARELRRRARSARLGMNGKGMRRIDGERRQHRENMLEEMVFEPIALERRQLARHRR